MSAPSLPLMRYLKPSAVASTANELDVLAGREAGGLGGLDAGDGEFVVVAEDAVDLAGVLLEEGFHDGLALDRVPTWGVLVVEDGHLGRGAVGDGLAEALVAVDRGRSGLVATDLDDVGGGLPPLSRSHIAAAAFWPSLLKSEPMYV